MPISMWICLTILGVAGVVGIQVFDRMSRKKDENYFSSQYAMLDLIRQIR